MLRHLFDAVLVSGDGWYQWSWLTGFQRILLACGFCWGRDGAVLRHEVGPPNAAISFIVLCPVVLPSVIDISGELIARMLALNMSDQIAGTFNLLTL